MKTQINMRPYAGEADVEAIVELWNACEAVDKNNTSMSVDEIRQALKNPSMDTKQGLYLLENTLGQLVGLGWLSIRPSQGDIIDATVGFRIHPDVICENFLEQIIAWGEEHLRCICSERGVSAKLYARARTDKLDKIARLEKSGFASKRYFFSMTRDLTEPIPQPIFPKGFTLRQVQGQEDALLWTQLYNESFTGHWNHQNSTLEEYFHWLSDPNYRSELDLVAIAADGTLAAFCRCWIYPESEHRDEFTRAYIMTLGTRPAFRRMGLGRAMLLSGMQRLLKAGMNAAKLHVDSENSHSALQFYKSVGFIKVDCTVSLVKEL